MCKTETVMSKPTAAEARLAEGLDYIRHHDIRTGLTKEEYANKDRVREILDDNSRIVDALNGSLSPEWCVAHPLKSES